jgi:hypothetical protein
MRQSTTPIQFERQTRPDSGNMISTGWAGRVTPAGYIPVLRGDSLSGSFGVDVDLADMPKPLLNAVNLRVQAWFVPKSAHPQFSGMDEFIASYHGETIKSLAQEDRDPPPFFYTLTEEQSKTASHQPLFAHLGISVPDGARINTDLIDAFNLVYNFRLAAHTNKITRRPYAVENVVQSCQLPRAFWPTGRFNSVVPDYERAQVVGDLSLDVSAGRIPISGLGRVFNTVPTPETQGTVIERLGTQAEGRDHAELTKETYPFYEDNPSEWRMRTDQYGVPQIFGEMSGRYLNTTLADIEKAKATQAFAKLRASYAGNDATGFDNDDAIVAELLQGFNVPEDLFKRPWLLDSKDETFGMVERHASDAPNLNVSVSRGRASASLRLNVPKTNVGGTVVFTIEVLPERIYEAASDEWILSTSVDDLPNALRDGLRPEPVDYVRSRRLDARHDKPDSLYGYEPMNMVWHRENSRLGGRYYQGQYSTGFNEQRAGVWQSTVKNPRFTSDHWLAPWNFPRGVFSDQTAPSFRFVAAHNVQLNGMTQVGDVLAENTDDYASISANAQNGVG